MVVIWSILPALIVLAPPIATPHNPLCRFGFIFVVLLSVGTPAQDFLEAQGFG